MKSVEEWQCHDGLRDDVSLVALEWKRNSLPTHA
jgi:hypothetical protein